MNKDESYHTNWLKYIPPLELWFLPIPAMPALLGHQRYKTIEDLKDHTWPDQHALETKENIKKNSLIGYSIEIVFVLHMKSIAYPHRD